MQQNDLALVFKPLISASDRSVNFVANTKDGGALEARFVQRSDDYFIVYLSSHTGCQLSCRFCHLTASKQTMMTEASFDDYLMQAKVVLAHYAQLIKSGQSPSTKVHFNFMARGEALSNSVFIKDSNKLFKALSDEAATLGLESRFMVSSIIPNDFRGDLSTILSDPRSMLYYSIYSVDPIFRKRWLPKAKEVQTALDEIAVFQQKTGLPITIHWAFIKGQNDQEASVINVMQALNRRNIFAKFNAVRYNPFDINKSQETDEFTIKSLFSLITSMNKNENLVNISRIVPRVGFDVKASCGMFV